MDFTRVQSAMESLTFKTHDQDTAIEGEQWHNQSGLK
jgi:hypothetical protein